MTSTRLFTGLNNLGNRMGNQLIFIRFLISRKHVFGDGLDLLELILNISKG